jgi:hypothetical protein
MFFCVVTPLDFLADNDVPEKHAASILKSLLIGVRSFNCNDVIKCNLHVSVSAYSVQMLNIADTVWTVIA